jgi:hypothetical protein
MRPRKVGVIVSWLLIRLSPGRTHPISLSRKSSGSLHGCRAHFCPGKGVLLSCRCEAARPDQFRQNRPISYRAHPDRSDNLENVCSLSAMPKSAFLAIKRGNRLRSTRHQILYDFCAPHPGYIDYPRNRHKESVISGWPCGFHKCVCRGRGSPMNIPFLSTWLPHGTFDFLTERKRSSIRGLERVDQLASPSMEVRRNR